jgi:hypothetical protein
MTYEEKIKRAQTGFTVVPNLPEPQFKPNTMIPFNAATLNPGAQFAQSGNNTLIVNPGGESTTTNFPTSRDIVNQSVQRALTARAASQPPTTMLDPYQQSIQDRQKQTEDQLMAGKDRSQFTVDWVSHGLGNFPVVRRLTPQEQQQNWADQNTMAQAEIAQGGKGTVSAVNVFGGGSHMDTPLLTQSRKDVSPQVWAAYRQLTRKADEKLNQALATRASVPHTIEEAQQFVDSLGFDDRVGEHVDRAMTRYMQNANPELYNQMIGQRELQKANDSAYVEWVRMSADPNVAKLSPEDILADRKQHPELQYAFDRDPNAKRYMTGPDGAIIEAPKRVLGPEETAQQAFKQESAKSKLEYQQQEEQVKNDPNLTISYRNGKREVMTKQQDMILANKQALEQARDERAQNQETLNYEDAQRKAEEFKSEPQAKRKKELESRYDKIVQRMDRTRLNEMKLSPEELQTQLARDTKLLAAVEKELIPEEPPAPPTNEPTATNAQGQKMVYRNGQWTSI